MSQLSEYSLNKNQTKYFCNEEKYNKISQLIIYYTTVCYIKLTLILFINQSGKLETLLGQVHTRPCGMLIDIFSKDYVS